MVTRVTIELDAVALATIQHALTALQLNAQATLATVQLQVQAQLTPPEVSAPQASVP